MNEIKIKNNFFLFFPFFPLTARDVFYKQFWLCSCCEQKQNSDNRRPHRLAGPGQRPFTPSTAVQIRLGTPKISIGYSSSVLGLQKLGYNFSSGDLLLRNFCFKQVFHYLPDAAASQSRKNFALVRVQPRAFRIAVRRGRPIMSHENLGSIQA